jgi:hypothetical protein
MKILALEHELSNAAAEEFQEYAKAEARQVWALVQAGVVRESYFRLERSQAILVLECPSVEQAREALSTLPYVQKQLLMFELIPLKAYPGFERLFEKE